jgi:serine/threonine-protein kinase RsbT
VQVRLDSDAAILQARQLGRQLAEDAGFRLIDLAVIATAISELARNCVRHASGGELRMRVVEDGTRTGMTLVVTDQGPGVADLALALQDGYSTSGNLGLGLPGVRRLMDEFHISSIPHHGTTVTATKWKR